MDTVGTREMFKALSGHKMLTALHKHYSVDELVEHFSSPDASQYSFYSMGIGQADYDKFKETFNRLKETPEQADATNPIQMVCVDVANGYTEVFSSFIRRLRSEYPHLVIMAGNVVTSDMTQELILAGADIVKVGIGPGSVCTTRKMTGVGYPQLSAIIECANAAHGLDAQICSDGGCTVPGDIAKAFGAAADFVMLGGMLSGAVESSGDEIVKTFSTNELDSSGAPIVVKQKYKKFYGMSSETAMDKHNGGVANYRASEGRTVLVPVKGPIKSIILDILGGLRSMMTYIGASKLNEVPSQTTFIRVSQQLNSIFEQNTIGK
jgi:GMP reductase